MTAGREGDGLDARGGVSTVAKIQQGSTTKIATAVQQDLPAAKRRATNFAPDGSPNATKVTYIGGRLFRAHQSHMMVNLGYDIVVL
jgi:hypothetical protein